MLKPRGITEHVIGDSGIPESISRFAGDINDLVGERVVLVEENNSRVAFLPERGGHIVSCAINGVELLYPMFGDIGKPKGGMPYMFPLAGPLTPEEIEGSGINLPQHGFGRLSSWEVLDDEKGTQRLTFASTPDYPFSGIVDHSITISDDGSIIFYQDIKNTGLRGLPVATGLHPYFDIPEGDKSQIEWRFLGGERVKNDIDIWSTGGTGSYDVPDDGKIVFFIPDIGEICLELSEDYKKFWVWSLPDKDFVCVEPVMGDVGMIAQKPISVAPGEINRNFMKLYLNKK